jgi:hypothetical protein
MSLPYSGLRLHGKEMPMLKSFLAVMALAAMACCFLPAWPAKAQIPNEIESDEFKTSAETIGGLRLDLPEKDVYRIITCVPGKAREILEGATGVYVQMWNYPECGIVLKMSSERKGGPKTVESVTLAGPSDLVTVKGIHIGSTESEVIKAYGRFRDREGGTKEGKRFVAGSIYDGMIFDFQNGRVVRIFLGAAAE